MFRPWSAVTLALVLLCANESTTARTEQTFSGGRLAGSISLGLSGITLGSDSVFLNRKLLVRGTDYSINSAPPILTLISYSPSSSDTLVVSYSEWPSWLHRTWGNTVPDANESDRPLSALPVGVERNEPISSNNLKLSGAKSFRMTSGPTGSTGFGQSLNLSVSGELAPGTELSGSVTDRGYDPVNGVANTRLDEFDRLYMRLKSDHLLAQVGDFSFQGASSVRHRDLSGGTARLTFPTYSLEAAVARPRGKFESVRVGGIDGFQGPYQSPNGLTAVVPGSEEVWLDGKQMEHGTTKDYEIDYQTGRITFTALHPIDSRSRIEFDYELLFTQYRQELLSASAGLSSRDSSRRFSVSLSREGDDKGQPLLTLDPNDVSALQGSKDSLIARTGVTADTVGSYRLLPDSLPDTVWSYVGAHNGDHTVRFSFVGTSRGEYVFVGGEQYTFVGNGKGDFLPLLLLSTPKRTESAQFVGTLKSSELGNFDADIRFSRFQSNLLSGANSGIDGNYHKLVAQKEWNWHGQANHLLLQRQFGSAEFAATQRIDDPDLARNYLLPVAIVSEVCRTKHDLGVSLSPVSAITLMPSLSRLEFGKTFKANSAGLGLEARPTQQWKLSGEWRGLDSRYQSSLLDSRGTIRAFKFGSDLVERDLTIHGEAEHDRRSDNYLSAPEGTRFSRAALNVNKSHGLFRYEYYQQDTLESFWDRVLTRHRLSVGTERSTGVWHVTGLATQQWLNYTSGNSHSLLGRANVSYDDFRTRTNGAASYVVSEELRNERGFAYLQVDPGRGNYRLEDGQYIPDAFGDYIRIEELLSATQRVRRGERSFRFSKESKQFLARLNSSISEDLLSNGKRPWWWIIPFASDETQPYLMYLRRYDGEIRLIALRSGYLFNVSFGDNLEKRQITGQSRDRAERQWRLATRQLAGTWAFEQGYERFSAKRDILYGDAGQSSGWRGDLGARHAISKSELSGNLSFRRATGESSLSRLVVIKIGGRVGVIKRGEIRIDTETYRQLLTGQVGTASAVLTDNHDGTRGFTWLANANYGLSKTLKFSVTLNGRYADSRPGQLFARGEMVAEF